MVSAALDSAARGAGFFAHAALASSVPRVHRLRSAHHSRAAFDLAHDHHAAHQDPPRCAGADPHVFSVGDVVERHGPEREVVFKGHSISGLVRRAGRRGTVAASATRCRLVVDRRRETVQRSRSWIRVVVAERHDLLTPSATSRELPRRRSSSPGRSFSGDCSAIVSRARRKRCGDGAARHQQACPRRACTGACARAVKAYDANDDPTLSCGPTACLRSSVTVYRYKIDPACRTASSSRRSGLPSTRTAPFALKAAARPAPATADPIGFSVGRFGPNRHAHRRDDGFSARPGRATAPAWIRASERVVERSASAPMAAPSSFPRARRCRLLRAPAHGPGHFQAEFPDRSEFAEAAPVRPQSPPRQRPASFDLTSSQSLTERIS